MRYRSRDCLPFLPLKEWSNSVVRCWFWSEVLMICIWSSWRHCHPIISCFIKIQIGLLAYRGCRGKEVTERSSVCRLSLKRVNEALQIWSCRFTTANQLTHRRRVLPRSRDRIKFGTHQIVKTVNTTGNNQCSTWLQKCSILAHLCSAFLWIIQDKPRATGRTGQFWGGISKWAEINGPDRQHQVVDRTFCGTVNQNDRG